MAVTTDEIRILLKVNGESSYTTAMNQVTNSTNKFNSSLGGLLSTLAKLVSAAAIVKFGKQCIEAASDLQEVANVVDVTFGKNATQIYDWAKQSAASFGLSQKAAEEYAGRFGSMAKQFGFTLDQATKMSIQLAQLSGDVASFYNMSDSDAMTKLKAIFTGETEGLKALGVVITESNLNAYALTQGMSKQWSQMSENEKVALRYSFVMDKLSHAQGDFSRTSDGWANSVRTFKLQLDDLKVEIGNELIPVASYGLKLVSQGLQAIGPKIVAIANTVKLYVQAWQQASEATKSFAQASVAVFTVLIVAPKAIALVRTAVRLLTMDIVTLGGALTAVLGVVGLIFAAIAAAQLSKAVDDMRNVGESAEVSADSVEELSDSLDTLGDSTQKLDTFLASFDEVNKVGGSSSLMSNLVNSDDIANIADYSCEVDSLQSKLNSITVPSITEGTILDKEWWKELGEITLGFFKELTDPGAALDDFYNGLEELGGYMEEALPNWTGFWEYFGEELYDIGQKIKEYTSEWISAFVGLGEAIYDSTHPEEDANDTFTWTSASGFTHTMQKYYSDGTETELYKKYKSTHAAGGFPNKGSLFLAGESGAELIGNFGGSQTRVLNQSQIGGSDGSQILFSPTIQIDGRKISAVVLDNINAMTRSSGRSPLIELGG